MGIYPFGLSLSNNVNNPENDLDIASGVCRSIANDADISLPVSITKRLDALWEPGSGNGGLDQGTKQPNASYHAFAISNLSTGASDVILSPSATNPMMPAGYTPKRRIGAVLTDACGNIRQFVQVGGWFTLRSPIDLAFGNFGGGTPVFRSAGVPTGVKMLAKLAISTTSSAAGYVAVTDPDLGPQVVSQTLLYYQHASSITGAPAEVWTDAAGRIYATHSSTSSVTSNTWLQGWYDIRDTSV